MTDHDIDTAGEYFDKCPSAEVYGVRKPHAAVFEVDRAGTEVLPAPRRSSAVMLPLLFVLAGSA